MPSDQAMCSLSEVQTRLGLDEAQVQTLVLEGRLRELRHQGRMAYKAADVERLAAELGVPRPVPAAAPRAAPPPPLPAARPVTQMPVQASVRPAPASAEPPPAGTYAVQVVTYHLDPAKVQQYLADVHRRQNWVLGLAVGLVAAAAGAVFDAWFRYRLGVTLLGEAITGAAIGVAIRYAGRACSAAFSVVAAVLAAAAIAAGFAVNPILAKADRAGIGWLEAYRQFGPGELAGVVTGTLTSVWYLAGVALAAYVAYQVAARTVSQEELLAHCRPEAQGVIRA